MDTYYCALAITSMSTRAVIIKGEKVLERLFIDAGVDAALEELLDFIFRNIWKNNRISHVIITGFGRNRRWALLKKHLERHSGLFSLDVLHGADIDNLLAMDKMVNEDPSFHRLELLAYISSVRGREPLESPSATLLEWMLNRSRDRALRLIELDKKLRQKAKPRSKSESYEQLTFE